MKFRALYEISNGAQLVAEVMGQDERVEASAKLVAVQTVIERIGGIAHALAGATLLCSSVRCGHEPRHPAFRYGWQCCGRALVPARGAFAVNPVDRVKRATRELENAMQALYDGEPITVAWGPHSRDPKTQDGSLVMVTVKRA